MHSPLICKCHIRNKTKIHQVCGMPLFQVNAAHIAYSQTSVIQTLKDHGNCLH